MKRKSLVKRIGFAVRGLGLACSREHSFRIELLAASAVLFVLVVLRPPPIWWAVGALAAGLVLVAELLNAALEALADRLHPDQHPEIRAAKDLSAGAVLLASVISVFVAAAFLLR